MTHVAITGAHGFLGWHVRCALLEEGITSTPISVGDSFNLEEAKRQLNGATALIHLAGVNRGTDAEVDTGNRMFAEQIASALRQTDIPPRRIAYANSTQSRSGNLYGKAKAAAGETLEKVAAERNLAFKNVILPNIFGEHGRPFHNAVTATFCYLLANGESPEILEDRELTLVHAQDAADALIKDAPLESLEHLSAQETVSGLLERLRGHAEVYQTGEIPDISDRFSLNLFNTYRSYAFSNKGAFNLDRHSDNRGSFFEIVRSHGGSGQSSYSTTVPGVTRGNHFHRRKVERFTVLSGRARISLRRLFSNEVVSFDVDGQRPQAVDMPTMWTHNITNTGSEMLLTSFWTNDIFDPARPDTIAQTVEN